MAKKLLTRREVLSLQSVTPGLLCSSSSLWAPCPFTDLPWVVLRFLSDIGFVAKTFFGTLYVVRNTSGNHFYKEKILKKIP